MNFRIIYKTASPSRVTRWKCGLLCQQKWQAVAYEMSRSGSGMFAGRLGSDGSVFQDGRAELPAGGPADISSRPKMDSVYETKAQNWCNGDFRFERLFFYCLSILKRNHKHLLWWPFYPFEYNPTRQKQSLAGAGKAHCLLLIVCLSPVLIHRDTKTRESRPWC